MISDPLRRLTLSLLVVAGLLFAALLFMGHPARATSGSKTFRALKNATWARNWPPSANEQMRAPGRLRQTGLFPLRSQSTPRPTDRWTKMAFQAYSTRNSWDIFTMPPGYYSAQPIVSQPGADFSPSLDFNASELVFVSAREGNDELYRVNLSSLERLRLTNTGVNETDPDWSPAGNGIAFARVVDGQEEIFRMAADGSGVTRLTTNSDRDLSPDWSPDGQQIVWAKRQDNAAALWIMNADGSDPHAITPVLPFLQNPRWSPQGDRIAFDYDADDDGYNELALIKPDGSDLQVLFDAQTDLVDLWLGSWSPEGDRVAFSEVLYVVVDNTVYIQDAMIGYLDIDTLAFYILDPFPNSPEMLPDWRKVDYQAPVSSLDPLPDPSPGPILVSWHGQDRGPSGIASYDVQVQEDNGEWQLWQDHYWGTDYSYPGVGGHHYAFRVRARDNAGNVEPWPPQAQVSATVETLPPHSEMTPLQPHERKDPVLHWDGSDEGGSHIASFDVQYRKGADGVWTDWLTKTFASAKRFPAETGVHYYFRVRARDTAGNVESWPPGDGNTSTTVYGWKMDGVITDLRGQPLNGVMPVTRPPGFEIHQTDASGVFTVYGHSGVDAITATWMKPGFGSLPPTRYTTEQDIHVTMTQPPPDNQVQDGDFEAPSLEPTWTISAQGTDLITTTWHSGAASLQMGCNTEPLAPLEIIPDTEFQSNVYDPKTASQLAVDDTGNVHVLDIHNPSTSQEMISYVRRSPSGVWSTPEPVLDTPMGLKIASLLADHQGNLHLLLVGREYPNPILYLTRPVGGEWSAPQQFSEPPNYQALAAMALDSQGAVHLVWVQDRTLHYTWRPAGGDWTDDVILATSQATLYNLRILIDAGDHIHVTWQTNAQINYLTRAPGGDWPASPESFKMDTGISPYVLRADAQGGAHFLIVSDRHLYYLYRRPDGVHSEPLRIDGAHQYSNSASLAVSPEGRVHIMWLFGDYSHTGFAYLQKRPDGSWTQDQILPYAGAILRLLLDSQGRLHLVWRGNGSWGRNSMLYYTLRGTLGNWYPVIAVTSSTEPATTILARAVLQNNDRLHFLMIPYDRNTPLKYRSTAYDAQPAGRFVASQPVHVPPAALQPTLSIHTDFIQVAGTQPSVLEAQIDDGVEAATPLTLTSTTEDWQHIWADMTPWAGQTVTLSLQLRQAPASLCAQARIDEVMLGSTLFPDLWIAAASDAPAAGGLVHQRILYGNAGAAPAAGTVVSATLPPEFHLLSAAPMPVRAEGDTWRWELGALPPGSGPMTIRYTATVASGASGVLQPIFHIDSEAPEPEQRNNHTTLYTFVNGYQHYLPRLLRK